MLELNGSYESWGRQLAGVMPLLKQRYEKVRRVRVHAAAVERGGGCSVCECAPQPERAAVVSEHQQLLKSSTSSDSSPPTPKK